MSDSFDLCVDPLIFSLSPFLFAKIECSDLGTALSAMCRPAEPPCGIPYAVIEQIGLTFEFSRSEVRNLEKELPTELQLLGTLSTQHECNQNSDRNLDWTSGSNQHYDIDDCPEIYRVLEEIQDFELPSLFQDDIYNLPSWEDCHVDVIPYRSTSEGGTVGLEDESMSLGLDLGEIDSRYIIGLARAGLRSIFCQLKSAEGTSGVQLSKEATGFKLSDISPALFRPGYSRVGFNE